MWEQNKTTRQKSAQRMQSMQTPTTPKICHISQWFTEWLAAVLVQKPTYTLSKRSSTAYRVIRLIESQTKAVFKRYTRLLHKLVHTGYIPVSFSASHYLSLSVLCKSALCLRGLGSLVVRALDLWLYGRELHSPTPHCRLTTLGEALGFFWSQQTSHKL